MATTQTLAGRSQVGSAYGGFWRRGVAAAIDWLLIGAVVSFSIGYHGQLAPPHSTVKVIAYYALAAVVAWLYLAAMEASAWQATLGKRVVGVKVTSLDGRRIGFGRATARLAAKLLSLVPLGLGFALAGVDARKRTLHDRVVDTLVVRE
ncbi:MAG TPA: RDD family protein [Actinomycetota bacterium]|nr:RDD family protein [Actinomycetota bacterium]